MVAINDRMTFQHLQTVNDAAGNLVAFAIDTTYKLWQVWRDPATQEWHLSEIEVGTGPMEQFDAYRTRITMLDAQGAPMPNAPITVKASGPTPAQLNAGDMVLLGPQFTPCRTDATGNLTVVVPADGLDTPTLSVQADFMDPSEHVAIEPNGDIQGKTSRRHGERPAQSAGHGWTADHAAERQIRRARGRNGGG